MRRIQLSGTSVALNAAGLGLNVTGAAFTLIASSAGDSLAHIISILNNTANSHAGKTITLVGTDANGKPQTEVVTGPAGSVAVSSTKYFLTLTSATPSATIGADTFNIGWTAASVSSSYLQPPANLAQFKIGFGCSVESGSPTYTVQHTYDGLVWFNHATVAAKTVSFDGSYTSPVLGIRLMWAAAGGVSLSGFQVGV